jgi:hypothetical protein
MRVALSSNAWNVAPLAALALLSAVGCANELDVDVDGVPPLDTRDNVGLQGVYDCSERADTGYRSGDPFPITVVTVDGRPVERSTANAYLAMQAAAANDGVSLRIVSGFRTMAEQEYFYDCYLTGNCNNGNLAARPGYSNHQSGHALDLNTSDGGVLAWLNAHGPARGWERTVASEDWHWEWWGNPSEYPGPCGADPRCVVDPNFGGCDGTVVTRCDGSVVSTGDCGAFGATCSTDGGTPHCVHPFCPANLDGAENGTYCRNGTNILQTCTWGQLTEGDCGFFGATCSEKGGQGHCVHPFCTANLGGGEDGTFCVDGTDRLATCTLGQYSEGDCAAFGAVCSEVGGQGHCVHPLCWTNLDGGEDGAFCLDDGTLVSCAGGVPTTIVCSDSGDTCAVSASGAACMPREAPRDPADVGVDEDDSASSGDDVRLTPFASSVKEGCAQGPVDVGAVFALGLLVIRRRRRAARDAGPVVHRGPAGQRAPR